MKTYTLEVLTDEDDELVTTILDALRKRNLIRFTAGSEGWSKPPASEAELAERLIAALASPRLPFAEARQRLGL
ncbi:MAG: hypothetical protein EOO56_13985 [Hymenobacter sp.]|nr:MAG: hypothetical protein EOO56_13985 [Hymenobacter sp.]